MATTGRENLDVLKRDSAICVIMTDWETANQQNRLASIEGGIPTRVTSGENIVTLLLLIREASRKLTEGTNWFIN